MTVGCVKHEGRRKPRPDFNDTCRRTVPEQGVKYRSVLMIEKAVVGVIPEPSCRFVWERPLAGQRCQLAEKGHLAVRN